MSRADPIPLCTALGLWVSPGSVGLMPMDYRDEKNNPASRQDLNSYQPLGIIISLIFKTIMVKSS